DVTAALRWSSANPSPMGSADDWAGLSSAPHAVGAAPSTWVRKPNRRVAWSDHITPTLPPGMAVTSAMSSSVIPDASVTGAENEAYGASAYRTWTADAVSEATHMRPVVSTSSVAVSLPGSDSAVAAGRAVHGT